MKKSIKSPVQAKVKIDLKKPIQGKKNVPSPICKKCVELHKRDTKYPVQCPYCDKILGCFYHPSGFHKHLTECKNKHKNENVQKNKTVESPVTPSIVVTGYKHPMRQVYL
jgi:hypothetical protein